MRVCYLPASCQPNEWSHPVWSTVGPLSPNMCTPKILALYVWGWNHLLFHMFTSNAKEFIKSNRDLKKEKDSLKMCTKIVYNKLLLKKS